LFVFVYIGVVAGFAAGAVIAWSSSARHRRARQRKAEGKTDAATRTHRKPAPETGKGAGATPPAVID
ncbi:MAG: hypothetical protein HKN28_20050, partial [Alphaproteobacteria bacterium]|nr:hypothetical protein [Alphaproteobacteria bacterium]